MSGKKIKLIRPIKDAKGENDITEITMKPEDQMSAHDFYDVQFDVNGGTTLGSTAPAIANLCGLTSAQVANLHPKDYLMLSLDVGKYIS